MASLEKLADLHSVSHLDLLARQVVEGTIIGLHKSPFHGFSVEFAEHRLYNPGESVKDIDWKVYARTGKTFVKRFEEETNLRCQIVIDASSSMYYPQGERNNKLVFSLLCAASLMHLLRRQRDAFGLSVFSEQIDIHTQARSTLSHYQLLINYMQQLLEATPTNKKTDAATALHLVADSIHKRSLVVIFSDMLDDTQQQEGIFSALQHLRYNKHEVLLFHVLDHSSELDFAFENRPYRFVDMETGETLKLQPAEVKDYYTKKMAELKKAIELKCGQYQIDLIEADIKKPFREVLIPYLTKRARMT